VFERLAERQTHTGVDLAYLGGVVNPVAQDIGYISSDEVSASISGRFRLPDYRKANMTGKIITASVTLHHTISSIG
jgi:hypothetical protein